MIKNLSYAKLCAFFLEHPGTHLNTALEVNSNFIAFYSLSYDEHVHDA